MRLDKMISDTGLLSRKEAGAAIRHGAVTVNGAPVRDPSCHVDPEADEVLYGGTPLVYRRHTYVMLNKPAGYVSATDDPRLPYVTELLPEPMRRLGLFPMGRLDRDTVGLMILTDDGVLSHALLSPRRHVEKEYRFTCDAPLPPGAEAAFSSGMRLGDEVCKSAVLITDGDRLGGRIVLTEGKYHQIKRMIGALGAEVTSLERLRFADLPLDPALARGEWRLLTEAEIASLTSRLL